MLATTFSGIFYIKMSVADPTIIYADDNNTVGPWDGTIEHPYQHIQDAINHSSDGDTIFVFSGIYYEHVVVGKSVKLIGENRNNTIIDGNGYGNVIYICYRQVLNNFTIRNGGPDSNYAGVSIECWSDIISNCSIDNCSIYNCGCGVIIWGGRNNTIINCDLSNNIYGIHTRYGGNYPRYNVIKNCKIHNNSRAVTLLVTYNNTIENCSMYGNTGYSIEFQVASYNKITNCNVSNTNGNCFIYDGSNHNIITRSVFSNNEQGIILYGGANNNTIYNNLIKNNGEGITIWDSSTVNNVIYHNNFIKNTQNVYDHGTNTWYNATLREGNYWSDYTGIDANHDGIGDTPYNIPGGSNKDLYPFMEINGNLLPIADFTYTPNEPINTDIIHFADTSHDPDGTIVSWWWNFGDHYYSDLQNPIHCYYTHGKYNVTLTVTDNDGGTNTSTRTILINTPVEILDQQQTQYKDNFVLYTTRWGGQSFKPTVTSLTRVEVFMRKAGSPPSGAVLSIRSSLTGADLVSIAKSASRIPTTNSWVEFNFSDLTVTPGTTYYLVLKTIGGTSKNCYYWGYGSKTPYTNGVMWYSSTGGITWTQYSQYDFCFKIYGM